jgi:hypothetical protein
VGIPGLLPYSNHPASTSEWHQLYEQADEVYGMLQRVAAVPGKTTSQFWNKYWRRPDLTHRVSEWCRPDLTHRVSEWCKQANIVLLQVPESLEEECLFSTGRCQEQ